LRQALGRVSRQQPALLGDYGDPSGAPGLRRVLVRHYAQIGCVVDPDEITVTHGCMEALNLALAVSTSPGDVVAVESPCYFGFLRMLEAHGLKALELPTDPRTGLSVEALQAALGSRHGQRLRACLLVPNFSNPLGCAMPDDRKRALVKLAAQHQLTLIEDDVYGDLGHDGQRPRPLKAFDRDGCVLLCSSFSKSLAPGARVGWIAGGSRTEMIRDRRYVSSIAVPALLQEALAQLLERGGYPRHLSRLRAACRAAVEQFTDAVAEHFPAGTRISRPQGGFVLWVELPEDLDTLDLFRRARNQGVAFSPGPLFSAAGAYRHCLRLNCAREFTPRTARAIATLGRLSRSAMQ
jgi:DNA-binding transcriptional MocR family regulator